MGEYLWGDHWNSGRKFKNSFSSYVSALRDASIQFSCSVLSDSLRPPGMQHARFPCPSPTIRDYSCPLSQWCHSTISSSVVPFSSCLQSFPASGFFLLRKFIASGGQSIGVSASASILQWIFRTDFLQDELVESPCSPRDSQESSPAPQQSLSQHILKHQFFGVQPSLRSSSHIHTWLLEKS